MSGTKIFFRLIFIFFLFFFIGCYDFNYYDFQKEDAEQAVKSNFKKIFGFEYDALHDWSMPSTNDSCYTFCFEDRPICDYDMNDVVIKARRLNDTQVEYSIAACGSYDELYIQNIAGKVISSRTELHDMFGSERRTINVGIGSSLPCITEVITVGKSFDFNNEAYLPYVYNKTTGDVMFLSSKGEDPHGIMIPCDFKYPFEGACVVKAYPLFGEWACDRQQFNDWYNSLDEKNVVFRQP